MKQDAKKKTGSRKGRPRRRWGRILFRSMVRLTVGSMLFVGFFVALVCFLPVSSELTDNLLRTRWREATGLRLDFNRSEWTISRGHVLVERPTIYDPDNQEFLFDLESVEINIAFAQWIKSLLFDDRPQLHVSQLNVDGPLELQFEQRAGGFAPSQKLRRTLEILKRRLNGDAEGEPAKKDAPALRLGFDTVNVNNASIVLYENPSQGTAPLLVVRDANLAVRFRSGEQVEQMTLTGRLRGRNATTGFALRLTPRADIEETAVNLDLLPFDSRDHLLVDLPLDFRSDAMGLRGNLRLEDERWVFHTQTSIPRLTLIGAGVHGVDQHFDDPVVNASFAWKPGENILRLLDVDFDSRDFDLKAGGNIELQRPYPYVLRVQKLELRRQGLSMIERGVFGDSYVPVGNGGRFEIGGVLLGNLERLYPDQALGQIHIEDLAIRAPNLPEPIRHLRVNADLTTDTLRINEAYGVVQGIPLQLSGELHGDPLEGKIARADIRWETIGNVESLADWLSTQGANGAWDVSLRGDVSGSGRLKLERPELGQWYEMMKRADIEGTLKFHRARLDWKKLDRPLENLSGAVDFTSNKAVLRDVAADVGDATLRLNGSVSGESHFWEKPNLDLDVRASLHLDSIEEYFRWFDREPPPQLLAAEGAIGVDAKLQGRTDDLAALAVSGGIAVEDFRLPIEEEHAGGTVVFPRLEFEVAPDRIRLLRAEGNWSKAKATVEGLLEPDRGTLTARVEADLSDARDLMPKIFRNFDQLGGRATADHRFELVRADAESAPAETFMQLAARAFETGGPLQQRIREQWKIEMGGEVELTDAVMLHRNMPLNARLSHITGRGRYDDAELVSIEPVKFQAGMRAENNTGEVRIRFKGTPNIFEFKVRGGRFNLDDWLENWRKAPSSRPLPDTYDYDGPPRIRMTVDAATDEVEFRGLPGRELSGELVYEYFKRRTLRLTWSDVQARWGNGRTIVSGLWEKQGDRNYQQYDIETQNMEVGDLFFAFYKRRREGGLETGQVTGRLHLHNDGESKIPDTGQGEFRVDNSRFISNSIFSGIGGILNLNQIFNDITFTRVAGPVRIDEGIVSTPEGESIVFEHPSPIHPLNMKANGRLGPERRLDMVLHIQFLPILNEVPGVSALWKVVNSLTGRILRYRVSGTLDNPEIKAAPSMSAP